MITDFQMFCLISILFSIFILICNSIILTDLKSKI
nr:MAG TPA: hypothetical protein [Caudoviricetes sp.]DAM38285.1 MAG TPA: hypothetical protein [Caudoviricetes sp.]DAN54351.1 MAG TPA: hypothetical protein [Caudoviricetes sp.]